jgi:hypothetical protein
MTTWRALIVLPLVLAAPLAAAAPPARAASLAKFDIGYAECEKRDAAMRGHGDEVYASLYRLKLDDALRTQLQETRKSAPYKSERRRAAQNLAKSAAASDVQQRLDLQCQALKKEIKPQAPAAAASGAR